MPEEFASMHWEGLDELVDKLVGIGLSVRRAVVTNIGNLGQYAMYLCRLELSDIRYTGALDASFTVAVDENRLRAEVYPTADHRMFVRMGTRPHWAPIGPLKRWAAVKLGDERAAYPVQRSIAREGTSVYQLRRRGTKANPWPERVVARGDFQSALQKTAQEIGVEIVGAFG